MATNTKTVQVKEIKKSNVELTIIGDSPLIVHNFNAKCQGEMLAKQVGVTWPKMKKDPVAQFEGATYYIDEYGNSLNGTADLQLIADGKVEQFVKDWDKFLKSCKALKKPRFGFPSCGLKASAIRGAKSIGLVMADMKGAFHVEREYVEIHHSERRNRSDMVTIGKGIADIRFRPEFHNWWIKAGITYNEAVVTPDMIVNMFNTGGFSCGIGEWRPERGGTFGMYHVAKGDEAKDLK